MSTLKFWMFILLGFAAIAVVAWCVERFVDTYERMREQREQAREEWYSRQKYEQTRDWTR